MGIMASAPFNGVDDENLAIAYIAMLLLIVLVRLLYPSFRRDLGGADVLKVTLFPLGGFLIIAKDFEGPDIDSEELRERMRLRRRRMVTNVVLSLTRLSCLFKHRNKTRDAEVGNDFEKHDTVSRDDTVDKTESTNQKTLTVIAATIIIQEGKIHLNDFTLPSSPDSTAREGESACAQGREGEALTLKEGRPEPFQQPTKHHSLDSHQLLSRSRHFLKEILKPTPVAIVISIVIALVDPLKALFLPPSSNFQPHFRPVAPDGQPPLAFVLDTATFVGAAGVPIGLICLGSALASLRVRSGEVFPRGAITALALAKMVITPLIGVGITRGFTHAGFVPRDDKVLQFVCM